MSSTISIIRGTNDKPVSSQTLFQFFSKRTECVGNLFIGYPIIAGPEGRHPIDALLVSPDHGIVVFDLVEGTHPGDYAQRQDDSANKVEARLKTHRDLVRRRDLVVPIYTLSFAPGVKDLDRFSQADYPLANLDTVAQALAGFRWPEAERDFYTATLSAIQSISTIRKARIRRSVSRKDSRGAKLKALEDSIATLDNLQSRAVIESVEGVQRIRGLAGSGKTIVLALKAAYLHAQHPDWRIAVTFNTRSLKGQFRRLISTFAIESTGEEPDFEMLRVVSAWGAAGGEDRDGIYHEFCRLHNVEYLDYRAAQNAFGRGNEFAGACERAMSQASERKPAYDAILVDEAQDFPPEFLYLCYELLDKHKRLVYAYDELQNLSGRSLPPPEEIFGREPDGSPRVTFNTQAEDIPRRDVILERCYRNSRPVLVTAHSVGFGIYRRPPRRRTTGLVQMFDHAHLWQEIGYRVTSGELSEGAEVALARTEDSSPAFLETHSAVDDLVQFHVFDSEEAQSDWLVREIERNLKEDELRHDDIVVINPDPLTTRDRVGPIRRRLLEMGISSHLAGVDTHPDVFFQSDAPSITFTGVFRAKGNEAGMVYVINAQDCHTSAYNLATVRNRLFTAVTRSKAWVRVLGFGTSMRDLCREFERLKEYEFELRFRYPTKEEREQLSIVHRDMTVEDRKRVKDRERNLTDLVGDLKAGSLHPEDLDEDLLASLRELLLEKGRRDADS